MLALVPTCSCCCGDCVRGVVLPMGWIFVSTSANKIRLSWRELLNRPSRCLYYILSSHMIFPCMAVAQRDSRFVPDDMVKFTIADNENHASRNTRSRETSYPISRRSISREKKSKVCVSDLLSRQQRGAGKDP